jgi:hypothetical protein
MPRSSQLSPGNDPIPILQEAGWSPGPVWKGGENVAPTAIGSPDRSVRSELLYRLSYPGPGQKNHNTIIISSVGELSVTYSRLG